MKQWLVRISYHEKADDVIGVVKTKDIEKYMNDIVKEILDQINGYEYQELKHLKREESYILCGEWNGVDCIKKVLSKEN